MTFMSTTGQPPASPGGAPGPSDPLRMTPGRWVALAVAVPVALALIGWTGFSLVASVARGSYPFSYTFPVRNGQVALNINAGDVTLHQAPASSTARLTGTVRYGLVRPSITESATSTSANVNLDCTANFNGNCGVSANLDVPAQTGVTLWSNGGDVTLRFTQIPQNLQITSQGGNVNVILPPGGTTYDISTPGLSGGKVNILSSLVDSKSPHKITIDSGGGDVTVSQG